MNILIPDSWLKEYLDTDATPKEIKDYLSLCGPSVERVNKSGDDFIYEIEITSNRVDMASVYGIARDAAAILPRFGLKTNLKTPRGWQAGVTTQAMTPPMVKESDKLPMQISDPKKICHRIMAVVMEVDPMKPSQDYIKERIEKSGVRALNNLVDITNYVMLELGHPTHVFDYDRIKTHSFLIRNARKNEPIITLDGKKYLLNEEDVIIDDGTGRVIDLPGIMGTENSVVNTVTRRILFFIESNNPQLIRKTSMRYGIRTNAATINEKHPDPELVKTVLLRGIELYQKLAGGKIASEIIDIYPNPPKPKQIQVSVGFINERLGITLKEKEITEILISLDFNLQPTTYNLQLLTVTPPTYRQFDVTIPEDIVEEVARIYGYHHLPNNLMTGKIPITTRPKILNYEGKIKQIMKYWGVTETYNYSFISKDLINKAQLKPEDHLKVANPLTSETEFMRISLIPSILENVAKNQFYSENLRLFELANIYLPGKNDLPNEIPILVISDQQDFYKLKGTTFNLLKELGLTNIEVKIPDKDADFAGTWRHFWHPQQLISVVTGENILGYVGKIHPALLTNFQIKNDLFLAVLNVDLVAKIANPGKHYTPIPTYPAVIEDLTIQYPPKTYIGPITAEIYNISKLIKKVEVVGRYQDSTTLRVTYQDEKKNLESADVQKVRTQILHTIKSKFKASLKS